MCFICSRISKQENSLQTRLFVHRNSAAQIRFSVLWVTRLQKQVHSSKCKLCGVKLCKLNYYDRITVSLNVIFLLQKKLRGINCDTVAFIFYCDTTRAALRVHKYRPKRGTVQVISNQQIYLQWFPYFLLRSIIYLLNLKEPVLLIRFSWIHTD